MKVAEWTDQEGRQTLRSLFNLFSRLKDIDKDMPVMQMVVLVAVALNEGKTQGELNTALNIPTSTMSRNIASLSSVHRLGKPGLGMITWDDHPTDRRAKLLALTPKGRAFLLQTIASL